MPYNSSNPNISRLIALYHIISQSYLICKAMQQLIVIHHDPPGVSCPPTPLR